MTMSREHTVKNLIPRGALPGNAAADIFNGHEHGNVPVSMFLVHNRPGQGPELHRHPYPEIFVVHTGQAPRFQALVPEVERDHRRST
jgi:quercetin dioxygenase-like cupin family protein